LFTCGHGLVSVGGISASPPVTLCRESTSFNAVDALSAKGVRERGYHASRPLIVEDRVYATGGVEVVLQALDAETGIARWKVELSRQEIYALDLRTDSEEARHEIPFQGETCASC
jgi:glucose dehydrogenase